AKSPAVSYQLAHSDDIGLFIYAGSNNMRLMYTKLHQALMKNEKFNITFNTYSKKSLKLFIAMLEGTKVDQITYGAEALALKKQLK
ncbi:MAG: hypothetical protein COB66_06215, partial [Coxiella sp. (in: Bacteria)]